MRKKRTAKEDQKPSRPEGRYASAPLGTATLGYIDKHRMFTGLLDTLLERICFASEGSEDWQYWATAFDRIHEAIIGRSVESNARMLLLESIHIAAIFARIDERTKLTFQRETLQINAWLQDWQSYRQHRDEITQYTLAFGAVKNHFDVAKTWAWEDPAAFVTEDFSRRESAYADALRTPEAQAKLRAVLDVWLDRGRPRNATAEARQPPKAKEAPEKWLRVRELMALLHLEGWTAEALQQEWGKRKENRGIKLAEGLLKR